MTNNLNTNDNIINKTNILIQTIAYIIDMTNILIQTIAYIIDMTNLIISVAAPKVSSIFLRKFCENVGLKD